MKGLVVYDSQYGNTEHIAQAIGAALAARVETRVVRAADVTAEFAGPLQRHYRWPAGADLVRDQPVLGHGANVRLPECRALV